MRLNNSYQGVPRSQIKESRVSDTPIGSRGLRLSSLKDCYQGRSGGGMGTGAPPLAATRDSLPWTATSVFKLIAKAKTNADRKATLSLRDIVTSSEDFASRRFSAVAKRSEEGQVLFQTCSAGLAPCRRNLRLKTKDLVRFVFVRRWSFSGPWARAHNKDVWCQTIMLGARQALTSQIPRGQVA